MRDYKTLGLNNKLQALNSLAVRQTPKVDSISFGANYDVVIDRLNTSKVNITDFIKRSAGGTALGTFSTSQALNLTSDITYNIPKADKPTFGRPIVGIYQGAGTTSGSQIYPIRGASVTLGRYDIIGGELDYSNYNGTSDQWRAMIVDTNGTSSQVITFVADWIFVDYATSDVG